MPLICGVLLLMLLPLTGCATTETMEVEDFPLSDSDLEILTTQYGVEFVRTQDSFE